MFLLRCARSSVLTLPLSAGGINPLLLNSLFGGMDLSSLQSLQSLQLAAGLMAFPPPTDPKQTAANAAAASMLPLMLPGMGGLPNMAAALPGMFSLGGLFGGNLATATAAAAAAASNSTAATATGNTNGTAEGEGGDAEEAVATKKRRREGAEKHEGEDSGEVGEDEDEAKGNEDGVKAKKKAEGEGGSGKVEKSFGDVTAAPKVPVADSSTEVSINGDAAALLAAAGMSANSLAFNPFLISTMAPGLLYPSMFLPPGLGGLSLPGFPTASTLAELQSAMAGALGGSAVTTNLSRDEEEDKKEGEKASVEEEDEGEEGGGESDLAEEKEGRAEGENSGEAERPALSEGGTGGEEEDVAAASPQKGKSD